MVLANTGGIQNKPVRGLPEHRQNGDARDRYANGRGASGDRVDGKQLRDRLRTKDGDRQQLQHGGRSGHLLPRGAEQVAPSLAAFGGKLWDAFIANNSSNTVLVCSSPDGPKPGARTRRCTNPARGPPSLAVFNNKLWVSFIANNNTNTVLVCSSADGLNWTPNTALHEASKTAPSLAVFNNKLWVSFIANNNTNTVLVCSSGGWPELDAEHGSA